MSSSIADPVGLCERLQAIRRELRSLAHEYRTLSEDDLDVDELGEPMDPGDVLTCSVQRDHPRPQRT